MATLIDPLPAVAAPPRRSVSPGVMPWAGRGALLFLLFWIYLGAMPFFVTFSPLLLYGAYGLIGVCAVAILSRQWSGVRGLRGVAPYLGWILLYGYWGLLVASPDLSIGEVAKEAVKNSLIIGAVALALDGPVNLRRFCNAVQAAALINAGLAFMELSRPEWVVSIALHRDPFATAFNPTRPAGLWCNPDEAAFALLFALFLSRWASPWFAWPGRVAALSGIYWSASRTGAYILVFCGILWLGSRLAKCRLRAGALAFWILGAVVAAGAALAFGGFSAFEEWRESAQFQRIIDFRQENEFAMGDPKRSEIAREALEVALEEPWSGHGAFSFQVLPGMPAAVSIGAHNIYLAVLGETGAPGLAVYLLVMALGFLSARRLPADDRAAVWLLWMTYLVLGLTWHNQFTSFFGMVQVALLFHLPLVVKRTGEASS